VGASAPRAGLGLALTLCAATAAWAQEPIAVRAGVEPALVQLGERAIYRGWVERANSPARVRWLAPEPDSRFTWGSPVVRASQAGGKRERVPAGGRYSLADTVSIEIPVQAFELGQHTIPGLRFEIDMGSGPSVHRLPTTTLTVAPVIAANDTTADFRAPHGPLAAPWWERVPWTWVVLGALAIAAIALFVRWWRRRRRAPAPAPAVASLDPAAEARAALAALRALRLPEHGRFAEHAFRLGQILRRYLEAVTRTTRPGDTTPELVRHLRQAGLPADDLTRLEGLLRVWDRVKFAREPFSREEAERAEAAVESFLQRPAPLARVA
jgi:hypothetical protein